MKLQDGIGYFNSMEAAFDLLKSLQEGSEDKNYLLASLSHKDLLLPDGSEGSIIMFAIQMQKYVSALYLINNIPVYETDEAISEAIEASSLIYNGYESAARLESIASDNEGYRKLFESYQRNNMALDNLKQRFLGVQRVNQ